ncbi:hypothetical protein CALCODRAFT_507039 [Calocera cornea HHB12733]|uniref:Uncharacterized protein n=1 Tax=Calocera cornea HHB12733 TaxID=1353952 RepID=A0A165I6Z5_9BASI|nr:hypothetical protein CALCODRAFT_507039 [Calocera cornea HHB12733]
MAVVLLWMRDNDDEGRNTIVVSSYSSPALFRSAISARWYTVEDDDLRRIFRHLSAEPASGLHPKGRHADMDQLEARGQLYADHVKVLNLSVNAVKNAVGEERKRWSWRSVRSEWFTPFRNLVTLIAKVDRPGDLLLISDNWICTSLKEVEIIADACPDKSEEWRDAVRKLMENLHARGTGVEMLHLDGIPTIPLVYPDLLALVVQRQRHRLVELCMDAGALSDEMLHVLRTCDALEVLGVTQRGPFFPVPRRKKSPRKLRSELQWECMLEMTLKGSLSMILSILQGMTIEPSFLRVHCALNAESIYSAQQLSHTIVTTFGDLKRLSIELDLEENVESLPIALRLTDFECLGNFRALKKLSIVSNLHQAMVVCDSELQTWLTVMRELEELTLMWPEEYERLEEKSSQYDKQHRRVTFSGILRLMQPQWKLRHLYLGHVDFRSLMEAPQILPEAPQLELQTRTAEVGSIWETALVLQRLPHYISIGIDEGEQSNVVSAALQYVAQAYEGREM